MEQKWALSSSFRSGLLVPTSNQTSLDTVSFFHGSTMQLQPLLLPSPQPSPDGNSHLSSHPMISGHQTPMGTCVLPQNFPSGMCPKPILVPVLRLGNPYILGLKCMVNPGAWHSGLRHPTQDLPRCYPDSVQGD